jgi:hypothetical protein
MQRRPEEHTQLRLATQLEVDVHAVRAWFRARRRTSLRTRRQMYGMVLAAVIFLSCLLALVLAMRMDNRKGVKFGGL